MKLHPNGIIEGTPEEISEYMRINRAKSEVREPERPSVAKPVNEPALIAYGTNELYNELVKRVGIEEMIADKGIEYFYNPEDGLYTYINSPARILINKKEV